MSQGASQLCYQPIPEAEAKRVPFGGRWGGWFVVGWSLVLGKSLHLLGPQFSIFKGLSLHADGHWELPGLLYQTIQRGHWQEMGRGVHTIIRPVPPPAQQPHVIPTLPQTPVRGLLTGGLNRYPMSKHRPAVWGLKFIRFGGPLIRKHLLLK